MLRQIKSFPVVKYLVHGASNAKVDKKLSKPRDNLPISLVKLIRLNYIKS